jgi:hypothetical protein
MFPFLIFYLIKETLTAELEFSALTDIDEENLASPDNIDDKDWISTPQVSRNLAALNNFLKVVHGRDVSPLRSQSTCLSVTWQVQLFVITKERHWSLVKQ